MEEHLCLLFLVNFGQRFRSFFQNSKFKIQMMANGMQHFHIGLHRAGERNVFISAKLDQRAAPRQILFNRVAPIYDNLNDVLSLGQHRIWKRMAVRWSSAKPGDLVLDVCCGTGDLSLLLADKVAPSGKVIGLDFAEELLALAKKRQKCLHKQNIEWHLGDALNMSFQSEEFDAVTMGYGLRNVTDIPCALKEIYRVLKPGATASILDFNKSTSVFTINVQEWILDNVVVPVATPFGLRDEYAYLKQSIANFLTGKELEKVALEAGFSRAVHYEIANGLMGILVLTKE